MIKVILNGENKVVESEVNIDQLLDRFSLPRQRIAVELNKEVVRRSDWPNRPVSDGDVIEVIYFVGGG